MKCIVCSDRGSSPFCKACGEKRGIKKKYPDFVDELFVEDSDTDYPIEDNAYYTAEYIPTGGNSPTDPDHYKQGGVEAKDYIKQVLGAEGWKSYCLGATMKYIHRHEYKGAPLEDLEKAHVYLGWAIQQMKEK